MSKRSSFVIYDSWGKMIRNMPAEKAGELVQIMIAHAIDGEEITTDDPMISAMFAMIKDKLDEDGAKYLAKVENMKNNSKNNSERNRTEIETKSKRNRTENSGDTESVSVSDTVSVSEEPKKTKKVKHKYGDYGHVALTDDEYNRLVSDYGEPGVKAGIDKVDKYCQKSGKTYKDYNLVLRDWGIEAPKRQKSKEVVIDPEEEAKQKAWEEGFHDA